MRTDDGGEARGLKSEVRGSGVPAKDWPGGVFCSRDR